MFSSRLQWIRALPYVLWISVVDPSFRLISFEPSSFCDPQWIGIDALRLYPSLEGNTSEPAARLAGMVHVRRPLDRAVRISAKVGKISENYNYAYHIIVEDICKFIEHRDLFSVDTQPGWNGCPLQEGKYNVSDVILHPRKFTILGEYWIKVYLIHPGHKEEDPALCSATLMFEVS